jgi:hypothetical protein
MGRLQTLAISLQELLYHDMPKEMGHTAKAELLAASLPFLFAESIHLKSSHEVVTLSSEDVELLARPLSTTCCCGPPDIPLTQSA